MLVGDGEHGLQRGLESVGGAAGAGEGGPQGGAELLGGPLGERSDEGLAGHAASVQGRPGQACLGRDSLHGDLGQPHRATASAVACRRRRTCHRGGRVRDPAVRRGNAAPGADRAPGSPHRRDAACRRQQRLIAVPLCPGRGSGVAGDRPRWCAESPFLLTEWLGCPEWQPQDNSGRLRRDAVARPGGRCSRRLPGGGRRPGRRADRGLVPDRLGRAWRVPPHTSDIDFVAVTATPPDTAALAVLEQAHTRLRKRRPRPFFDGCYLT